MCEDLKIYVTQLNERKDINQCFSKNLTQLGFFAEKHVLGVTMINAKSNVEQLSNHIAVCELLAKTT